MGDHQRDGRRIHLRALPPDVDGETVSVTPAVRTTVSGEGSVVFHDETRYGLRRLCVASYQKYPDLETWLGMLPKGADAKLYLYVEKEARGISSQFLWIYWKE